MKLFEKDLDREVVVIAEIGMNHEGSLPTARKLIDVAAESGADAVKLQSYTPDRYVSRSQHARFSLVQDFALDQHAHVRLQEAATAAGIAFFSTPLTEDWVDFLAERCDALKIASGDLTFEPTIRAAARTPLPILLSTGMANLSEIARSVSWIEEESAIPSVDRLVLLHCVSAYPPPAHEFNLRAIVSLRESFGCHVGYSNHSRELSACCAAVALGARVIEVHVTDERRGKEFHDHQISAEPSELKRLVRDIAFIAAALGDGEKIAQPSELANRKAARKGVVAARDLPKGRVLERNDLMFARPASEFEAGQIDELLGRQIRSSLQRGELIARDEVS